MTPTKDIIAMYRRGMSLRHISGHVGITQQAIHQRLIRAGIDRRAPGSPCDAIAVLKYYKKCKSPAETARKADCCLATVYRVLKDAGIAHARARRRHDHARMIQFYREGKTPSEIARAMTCAQSTVFSALVKAGVHIAKGKP